MAQEEVNPTDVYENKELQKDFTQLLLEDEPVAIIIPFRKEVESTEDIIDDNPEDNNETVNFSEIIESSAGLYDNNELPKDEEPEEEKNKRLLELKQKVLDSDKDNSNLKDPKNINYITDSSLKSITIWKNN